MLTLDQFNALNLLRTTKIASQREFAATLGFSLGKANGLIKKLASAGWIEHAVETQQSSNIKITPAGIDAMKPYKVDNAIIMAAGMSSRFAPLSYEKPKGVLEVKGEVLIERQIRQLHEAGINDITVVVGYMKEKFEYLRDLFGAKIVENPDYAKWNNTSTIMKVLPKLKNTYICSSDNYFMSNVFEPYVYQAYYSATFYPGPVKEWGIKFNEKGRITGISHYPIDMWCMMGHVYFSREFSEAFKPILRREFENDNTKLELWEAVYERNVKKLPMYIKKYPEGVVLEFDSVADLCKFDQSYIKYLPKV